MNIAKIIELNEWYPWFHEHDGAWVHTWREGSGRRCRLPPAIFALLESNDYMTTGDAMNDLRQAVTRYCEGKTL